MFIRALLALVLIPGVALAYVGTDSETDPIYSWSDTLHPEDSDSPVFAFSSISRSGTRVDLATGSHGPIDIGFPFDFYEDLYDEVYLNNMGLLGFGAIPSGGGPTTIPTAAAPNGFVAGLWAFYDTWMGSGTAYYVTRGASPNREFVAEWSLTTPEWTTATFQVVLQEASGDILVHVQSGSSSRSNMVVGIENRSGTRGIAAYNRPGVLSSYSAVFSSSSERPRVRVLNDELIMPEGGSLTLEVEVTDAEDEIVSITWDLDSDGEFDDGEGETVEVPGTHTNGPGTVTPTIRAEDEAGNVRELTILIEVTNEPPVFRNEPVTEVLRSQEWTYEPAIQDPGDDEVTVTTEDRPDGMALLAGGGLRWTPEDDDVGEHTVRIVAVDADDDPDVEGDGDAVLEFTLTVLDNTRPGQPVIVRPEQDAVLDTLRPTFLVQTPEDPEGDQLDIYFDVDTSDTFASPDRVTSGPVRATLGQTGWTCTQDLVAGESYWWRVYAHDGIEEGTSARGRFTIEIEGGDAGPDAGDNDGGIDPDPGDADIQGCGCRSVSSRDRSTFGGLLLLAFLALALRSRRR